MVGLGLARSHWVSFARALFVRYDMVRSAGLGCVIQVSSVLGCGGLGKARVGRVGQGWGGYVGVWLRWAGRSLAWWVEARVGFGSGLEWNPLNPQPWVDGVGWVAFRAAWLAVILPYTAADVTIGSSSLQCCLPISESEREREQIAVYGETV